MLKIAKIAVSIIGIVVILGVSYGLGAWFTWFNANMCYSSVIDFVSDEAVRVAKSNDSEAATKFQDMIKSLPIHGYETECNAVKEAISKYKEATNVQ
ncbi:hypothetical protein [Ketobacter alkanivorans]|uniref:Uncharacterized protein n=1 Tax=Ketobacter alkanivorans TaxID=1917421 RepID=A0A2K9LL83_9GAMM|nr:hypothetical protein [Ketobacter alkanivorans]AUM13042.1 hypothetical protein Kalk_11680 [Ketobacter alkanivorans]